MSIKNLNPYILFNGTAAAAMQLYQSALGAKTEHIMRYGDAPGAKTVSAHKDFVMHAVVRIGPDVVMVSDTPPDQPVASGGNVHLTLHYTDLAEMAKAFDALAAGGKVMTPLQDMFWGARFGVLTDRFGVQWMFNGDLKKPEA